LLDKFFCEENMKRVLMMVILCLPAVLCLAGGKEPRLKDSVPMHAENISDPFAAGWMLVDTNGDGIADAVVGKIVVPDKSSAAENAAAANFAARVGYGSTGLTLPMVITASESKNVDEPRILIGKAGLNGMGEQINSLAGALEKGQGGVFVSDGNLAVLGADDAGLEAAADAYAARAPYQWKVPGDKFSAIADAVNTAGHGSGSSLQGVIYAHGQQRIFRAIVRADFAVTAEQLTSAFDGGHLAAVREIVVLTGGISVTATNPKPMPATAAPSANAANSTAAENSAPGTAGESGAAGGDTGGAGGAGAATAATKLDLATLYTSRGLFTGSARMPVPSSSDAHLYIPAGATGVAMANFAARMGMEATGITLPIASPAAEANARQVRAQAIPRWRRKRNESCALEIRLQRRRKLRWHRVSVKYARWMKRLEGAARFLFAAMTRARLRRWNFFRGIFRIFGIQANNMRRWKRFATTCTDFFRCDRAWGSPRRLSII
jgi:hypothetical protein